MISEELYLALREWRRRVSAGIYGETFDYGLCGCVTQYAMPPVSNELDELLLRELGDMSWPFNDGNSREYWQEKNKGANPLRRAWVDAKIKEYEES